MTRLKHFPTRTFSLATLCLITTIALTGCKAGDSNKSTNSATDVEKVKPAPGTGNVQGQVLYNSKPAENIEVKLCETFSQFVGGCGGKIYTARTDKDGTYVITNVAPKTYEVLTATVFDTNSYVFATSGIGISATKYEVVGDKTLFVKPPINLFKSDLKTISPKAAAKVTVPGLELKWEAYPDASYYKFSVYAEDNSVTSPYVNERSEATSFTIDKPLQKGTYRWQVNAYNKDDKKLSESSNDMKFTVGE